MQSSFARAAIGVGTIALIVVLFIVLSGGDDEPDRPSTQATTTAPAGSGSGAGESAAGERTATRPRPARPRPKTIVVRGGQPVGGVRRLEFEKGDRVRLLVRSDVTDEVHVHGYDIRRDVAAGGSVRFNFRADLEGVFEIELETGHVQIAQLRVSPS